MGITSLSRKPLTRRSFLKICATSSAAALLAACGKRNRHEDIQSFIPTDQPSSTPLPKATSSPELPEAPKGIPPANTRLPPNWTRGKVFRERTLIFSGAGTNTPNCNPLSGGGQLLEACAYYSATADKTILWLLDNFQYSADATQLTLKFRTGIEWSDGKAFSARDVQFGFETAKLLGWSEITGVEVIDNLTLQIKLTKSDWRFFFRNLVYSFVWGNPQLIVPEHIFKNFTVEQLQAQTFSFFDPEKNYPVVSGPYMMVKTDPDILKEFDSLDLNVFDLRPDWWAVKTGLVAHMPDVERVITVGLNGSPEDQFSKNLVDFCDASMVSPEAIRAILSQARQVNTWTGDKPPYGNVFPTVVGLGFNCQQAPFDDPRLRWAVAYAINQTDLLARVYGRDVEVVKSPFPDYPAFQKFMEGISDLAGEYNFLDYSPDKSTQSMQAAGFLKDADGFWADQNGIRAGITLYADGPNNEFSSVSYDGLANQLDEQLRQAGFNCQIKLIEDSVLKMAHEGRTEGMYTWRAAAQGLAPLFILDNLGAGINDPMEFILRFRKGPPGQEYDLNVTHWVDDSFIKAADELDKLSPDDPRSVAAFRNCMEIWYKNLPFIPLCQTYNRVPYNTRFWQNWPSAENPYIEVGFSNLNSLMLVINLEAQT